MTVLKYMLH